MDLVFLGSGEFGVPTLAALSGAHRVRAIITQPDRAAGRGGRLTPTPVAQWAAAHAPRVPVLKPVRVNDPAVLTQVRAVAGPRPVFVVIAFGQKLGRALLDGVFAINLHASLLPRWRGAAPINAAVLAGDRQTGNSVISLAEVMDAGLVYGQSQRTIELEQTAGELHDLLAADGPGLVLDILERHAAGELRGVPQDAAKVTLAPKLSRADAWVDLTDTAELCRRRIHGLTPWPGVWVRLEPGGPSSTAAKPPGGGAGLKLWRVRVEGAEPGPTHAEGRQGGAILDAAAGLVACGGGTALRLLEVQPAGGRKMAWADFVRGHRIGTGARLMAGRQAMEETP
jgi:methionyl-tRNA formyltransferase